MLNESLPINVNLLTLDQRSDGTYLLRLEHLYGEGEDQELSKPIVINLRQVFVIITDFYFWIRNDI